MFPSDALLQLVFANDTDIYFCNGFMQADLNQYLWLKLHEKFKTVRFMYIKDDLLYYRTFGKSHAQELNYDKNTLGKIKNMFSGKDESSIFGDWICEQLTNKKERCVFVFSIIDFCEMFKRKQWKPVLERINKLDQTTGSIVLIAPPDVNTVDKYLTKQSVISTLKTSSFLISDISSLIDYYTHFKKNMKDSCIFLNTFDKERIRTLLVNLVNKGKHDYPGEAFYDNISVLLSRYLCSRFMQLKKKLFSEHFNYVDTLYSELHDQLLDKKIWNGLQLESEKISSVGIEEYIRQNFGEQGLNYKQLYIYPEKNSSVWRCMSLMLYAPADTNNEKIAELILRIYQELDVPNSGILDQRITETLERVLYILENAVHEKDIDTYERSVYALYILSKWVYKADMTEQNVNMIESLKKYLDLSISDFETARQIEEISHFASGSVNSAFKLKKEQYCISIEKVLAKMDEYIPVYISNSMQTSHNDAAELESIVQTMIDLSEQNCADESLEDSAIDTEHEEQQRNIEEDENLDMFLNDIRSHF